MGCIPPPAGGEFVAPTEDVPDVYERPYDPARPQVRPDETSKQWVGEAREPLPMTPGRPRRYDSEYVRDGSGGLALHHGEPVRRHRAAGSLGDTWR